MGGGGGMLDSGLSWQPGMKPGLEKVPTRVDAAGVIFSLGCSSGGGGTEAISCCSVVSVSIMKSIELSMSRATTELLQLH